MAKGRVDGQKMACGSCGKPVNITFMTSRDAITEKLYSMCPFCIYKNFIE